MTVDYSQSPYPVRADLVEAHQYYVDHVRASGTWWTGRDRVAIALESRAADDCPLCIQRKAALSPNAVSGDHTGPSDLPPNVVDVIHRVRSDPGRLSKAWFDEVMASGLAETHYVELIALVTQTAGIDNFARALGVAPPELQGGDTAEPSGYRPASAKHGTAWVAMIDAEDAIGAEADLYDEGNVPNIERALSLVPDQVRALRTIAEPHYMSFAAISDMSTRLPGLDRLQMELVASRVSAMNECFY